MARRGVSLLVTVDCGSTSDSVIEDASALGVDTIVTDHHVLLDDPPYPVVAMVNPRRPDSEYPFGQLTGAGTAYKVAQALYRHGDKQEPPELLALTALGTVGDVGPLLGENRYIVAEGIRRMNATRSVGLEALTAVSGIGGRDLERRFAVISDHPKTKCSREVGRPGDQPESAHDNRPGTGQIDGIRDRQAEQGS